MQYQGHAATDLHASLDAYEDIYSVDIHYGRTVAIIQSSGTGKSRAVQELLQEVRSDDAIALIYSDTLVDSRLKHLLSGN